MVENFNDRYQQRFLAKVVMTSMEELETGSLAFEQRHNSKYRYSKLIWLSVVNRVIRCLPLFLKFWCCLFIPDHRQRRDPVATFDLSDIRGLDTA